MQNEIILFVHCYCKLDDFIKEFRLTPIEMQDGGKCNVYIEINLSKINIHISIPPASN